MVSLPFFEATWDLALRENFYRVTIPTPLLYYVLSLLATLAVRIVQRRNQTYESHSSTASTEFFSPQKCKYMHTHTHTNA